MTPQIVYHSKIKVVRRMYINDLKMSFLLDKVERLNKLIKRYSDT